LAPARQPWCTPDRGGQLTRAHRLLVPGGSRTFFTVDRTTVTDAVGTTWSIGDIYETSALVTIYGMFFIAALGLLRIAQQRTAAPALPKAVKQPSRRSRRRRARPYSDAPASGLGRATRPASVPGGFAYTIGVF
jgi:hypothetical protein